MLEGGEMGRGRLGEGEEVAGGGGGDTIDVSGAEQVDVRQALGHKGHPTALVALATVRNGCHIGRIGFEHEVLYGNVSKRVGQLAVLERQYSADTEIVTHPDDLLGYLTAAAETMEHALHIGVGTENLQAVLDGIATMYHDGQAELLRPIELGMQYLVLLRLVGGIEMIVKSYLTDGDVAAVRLEQLGLNGIKLLLPIGLNILRM